MNTQQAVAVSMYKAGETVAAIIDATGLDQDEIADAVRAAGHHFFAEPQDGSPAAPARNTPQGLIAWGMQHQSPKMQRLADQARTALADLQQARRRRPSSQPPRNGSATPSRPWPTPRTPCAPRRERPPAGRRTAPRPPRSGPGPPHGHTRRHRRHDPARRRRRLPAAAEGAPVLRDLLALRIARTNWPYPALELVRPDGRGWLLIPLTLDLTTRDQED
ncbi:hypothetical protein [Kitasatospora cheerisanensis]|uniref:Uncharacterized protein n=1 Tax=Kitasatospora cheerisanensis KCTC 2395 TaxID=1348663 RepID=A0A066YTY1_9ACTN|nr:hypothetical protein [Kitasatospora cheerisanensis]KDN83449.1 hypothetical protein KCH_49310 [Kitasatospora cheerisanensis KCTC 2395]